MHDVFRRLVAVLDVADILEGVALPEFHEILQNAEVLPRQIDVRLERGVLQRGGVEFRRQHGEEVVEHFHAEHTVVVAGGLRAVPTRQRMLENVAIQNVRLDLLVEEAFHVVRHLA